MVAFALGTPRLTLTQPITGFAQGVGFGTPNVSLVQKITGFAQAVAFGTPTVISGALALSPTGYAQSAGFSTTPVITPTGQAQGASFASPPIIAPVGFPRDPYLGYVTFHSHFDAAAPTDVSKEPRTISLSSIAVVNVERPKFGAMALRTNGGVTGLARVEGSPVGNQFGAGQFTIELWVNWTSWTLASTQTIISAFGAAATFNRGWMLRKDGSNNNLKFYYSTTGADAPSVSGAFTPVVNQWYHIAVDRDSSNFLRIYANGVQIAGGSVPSTLWPSTEDLRVGNDSQAGTGTQGYIDEVRITKGVARYGGAFTPPTAPFQGWAEGGGGVGFGNVSVVSPAGQAQAIAYGNWPVTVPSGYRQQAAFSSPPVVTPAGFRVRSSYRTLTSPIDPYWSSTILACPFDSTLDDASERRMTAAASGGAALSTVQSKFGGSSALIGTAPGGTAKIVMSGADANDLNFDAGAFTIEAWAYFNNNTASSILRIVGQNVLAGPWMFRWYNNQLGFLYSTNGTTQVAVNANWIPNLQQWYHLAVDRDASGNLRIYVDGSVILGPTSVPATFYRKTTTEIIIGNDTGGVANFVGYLDDVRVTKGVARYGGAFSVPTAALPLDGINTAMAAVPAGYSQPTAYGTLAKAVPTGAYAQFVAGGLPVAVPTGAQWGFGVGDGTVAIPFGDPETVAFGAPIIRLTLPPTPSRGGLRLAQWTFDELVKGWCRLEKLRKELEERQERLEREKRAARRRRGAASTSITPERRLDKLIADCNQALFDLQEREDELYAGLRSFKADVEAIGAENRAILAQIEADYQKQLLADDEEAILALM